MGLTIRPADLLGATFVVGPTGRVVHWSQQVGELLGISARRALRRPCREVLPCSPSGCEELRRALGACERGAAPPPFEAELGSPPRRVLCTIVLCQLRAGRYLICQLHPHEQSESRLPPLTSREGEILGLLARGEDTTGIAEELGIRTPTVRNHMRRLLRKLGAHSRLEAVVMAVRAGLVKV